MKRIRLQRAGLKKLRLPEENLPCRVHFRCTKDTSTDRPGILLEEGIFLMLEKGLETALERNGAMEFEAPSEPTRHIECETGETLRTEREEILNLEQQ